MASLISHLTRTMHAGLLPLEGQRRAGKEPLGTGSLSANHSLQLGGMHMMQATHSYRTRVRLIGSREVEWARHCSQVVPLFKE